MTTTPPPEPPELDITGANERAQQVIRALKAVVRELTGGWTVGVSSGGSLFATRPTNLTNDELRANLHQTVFGDDAASLVAKLNEQITARVDYLSGKSPNPMRTNAERPLRR